MRPALRHALFAPLACALLYGCPSETDTEEVVQPIPGYEDVVYEGGATDEALVSLVSALDQGPPQSSSSQAPVLAEPPAGELSQAAPPTFRWALGATAGRMRLAEPPSVESDATAPGVRAPSLLSAAGPPSAAERLRVALGPLAELLGPARAAHAHGTPFSGNATFLVLSSESEDKLVRVFTGASSYTPSAEAWGKVTGAGAVTLTLVGAAYEQNRIAVGGGPFQGSVTSFTIAP